MNSKSSGLCWMAGDNTSSVSIAIGVAPWIPRSYRRPWRLWDSGWAPKLWIQLQSDTAPAGRSRLMTTLPAVSNWGLSQIAFADGIRVNKELWISRMMISSSVSWPSNSRANCLNIFNIPTGTRPCFLSAFSAVCRPHRQPLPDNRWTGLWLYIEPQLHFSFW